MTEFERYPLTPQYYTPETQEEIRKSFQNMNMERLEAQGLVRTCQGCHKRFPAEEMITKYLRPRWFCLPCDKKRNSGWLVRA